MMFLGVKNACRCWKTTTNACITRKRYIRSAEGSCVSNVAWTKLTLCVNIKAARTKALQTAYRRAEAASPRDSAPKAGQIRNLGLLDADDDTKAVLGSK